MGHVRGFTPAARPSQRPKGHAFAKLNAKTADAPKTTKLPHPNKTIPPHRKPFNTPPSASSHRVDPPCYSTVRAPRQVPTPAFVPLRAEASYMRSAWFTRKMCFTSSSSRSSSAKCVSCRSRFT